MQRHPARRGRIPNGVGPADSVDEAVAEQDSSRSGVPPSFGHNPVVVGEFPVQIRKLFGHLAAAVNRLVQLAAPPGEIELRLGEGRGELHIAFRPADLAQKLAHGLGHPVDRPLGVEVEAAVEWDPPVLQVGLRQDQCEAVEKRPRMRCERVRADDGVTAVEVVVHMRETQRGRAPIPCQVNLDVRREPRRKGARQLDGEALRPPGLSGVEVEIYGTGPGALRHGGEQTAPIHDGGVVLGGERRHEDVEPIVCLLLLAPDDVSKVTRGFRFQTEREQRLMERVVVVRKTRRHMMEPEHPAPLRIEQERRPGAERDLQILFHAAVGGHAAVELRRLEIDEDHEIEIVVRRDGPKSLEEIEIQRILKFAIDRLDPIPETLVAAERRHRETAVRALQPGWQRRQDQLVADTDAGPEDEERAARAGDPVGARQGVLNHDVFRQLARAARERDQSQLQRGGNAPEGGGVELAQLKDHPLQRRMSGPGEDGRE